MTLRSASPSPPCYGLASLFPLLIVFSFACNGPLPFMSGGQLSGEEESAPKVWDLEEDFAVAQLETQPAAPYSVNVAYTQRNGRLYVNAGDTETNWVKHIAVDPQVRLRIGDVLYRGKAVRVTDPLEIGEFGRAWRAESSFHRDPEALDQVWLYKIVPNAAARSDASERDYPPTRLRLNHN